MDTLDIVLLVVAAAVLLIVVSGFAAGGRRQRSRDAGLRAKLAAADAHLAEAHASDKGWERTALESAARAAFTELNPGAPVDELHLIKVIDNPGKDDDRAVFRITSGSDVRELQLARRGDEWFAG